ncbi:DUF4143 domain-containing protein [Corynebacterium cystitidis]|uniref:DUF4143 domain-containing protein n=1 Tax=Corynebacterium cystitidis TaxID=35757 RepID=UPI001E2A7A65|nr:DUF4143 domain-containing protein [Corynebacterium cystitidis]
MLPLSFAEVGGAVPEIAVEHFMVRGGYPRLYQVDMPYEVYHQNDIRTYRERDVTQLLKVQNIAAFRQLLGLLALNTSNVINYTGLARDLGFLSHLLRIRDTSDLVGSVHVAAVMENLVVAEPAKHDVHQGVSPELFFYRDDSTIEIDLLDLTDTPRVITVKASATYRPHQARHLATIGPTLGIEPDQRWVVYRRTHTQRGTEHRVVPVAAYLLFGN